MPNMHNCLKRSELDLHGPQNGRKFPACKEGLVRGVRRRCWPLNPIVMTKQPVERAGGTFRGVR
eukprot:7711528-Alexandrium_andersonii.AAC.1